jgi:hypothetical protein
LMASVLHDHSSYREARSSSQPYFNCKISKINEGYKVSDLNNRPKLILLSSLSIWSVDLIDDRKLGYGFTSADELEEVDIGPGDKPQPTFISKKLSPCLREPTIALLKEYADCFAWDYTEMPGLDRGIVEHRLLLKKGFWPFQQRARQMKAEISGESQERGGENARSRIHQALQVCWVDFKCCTCAKERWPMVSLCRLQRPKQGYSKGRIPDACRGDIDQRSCRS